MTNTDVLFTNLKVWARRAELTPPTHDEETAARLVGKLNRLNLNVASRRSAITLVAGKILLDGGYNKQRVEWGALLVADMVYAVCHDDLTFSELDVFAERLIEEHGSSFDREVQLVVLAKNLIAARHAEYSRPRSLMDAVMRRVRG